MCIKKGDLILAAVLLAAALLFLLLEYALRKDGAVAAVYVDGKKTAEYSLNENREIRLDAPGGAYNILVIEDGYAYVSEASCPDRVCVNMHRIRYDGESITCLPNKTVIRIEGGAPSGVDIPG